LQLLQRRLGGLQVGGRQLDAAAARAALHVALQLVLAGRLGGGRHARARQRGELGGAAVAGIHRLGVEALHCGALLATQITSLK
jgi:hypothetical protein